MYLIKSMDGYGYVVYSRDGWMFTEDVKLANRFETEEEARVAAHTKFTYNRVEIVRLNQRGDMV